MFESYEMPAPASVAALDDLGLVDAIATATLVESLATEVRIAAIQEMYIRQSSVGARTHPKPSAPRAALPASRRRRRKARKHRRRRR
jgi:hypothetical protein